MLYCSGAAASVAEQAVRQLAVVRLLQIEFWWPTLVNKFSSACVLLLSVTS